VDIRDRNTWKPELATRIHDCERQKEKKKKKKKSSDYKNFPTACGKICVEAMLC